MSKKNFLTVIVSTSLTVVICYFIFFLKIYYKDLHQHPYRFKSTSTLNFNKKYYKKFHHLRDVNGRWEEVNNPENYLFTIINNFTSNKKNILLQGDSWMEQMIENNYKKSHKLIYNFVKKKNFGLINAGVTSFSPSLMQIQYEVLEKDFKIKPNIVIAYIDQTDIGDELCRYKDKRVYNKNNKLISIKKESFSRSTYDYTKIFYISEIVLSNDSALRKNYKLTNFYIKYEFYRLINKIKSIKNNGWENRNLTKCKFREIRKYLIESNSREITYFENRVKDYINLLLNKSYIEKIILVTFPHHDHVFGYKSLDGKKKHYRINVSNIIDKIIKNNDKIYHLNFSKLILDKKIDFKNDFYFGDSASHLKERFHSDIFTKNIIDLLK